MQHFIFLLKIDQVIVIVSFIECSLTNHHKNWWLKQQCIISQRTVGSLDSSLDLCSVSWGHSYQNWTGRSKKPSFLPWHRLLAEEPAFPSKQPLSLCSVSIGTLRTSSFSRNENFLNACCLGSKKMKVETAWPLRDQELP